MYILHKLRLSCERKGKCTKTYYTIIRNSNTLVYVYFNCTCFNTISLKTLTCTPSYVGKCKIKADSFITSL